MKQWRILARHRWVSGATITESVNEIDEDIRRFTATIRGWKNFRIYEGDPRHIETKRIMERVMQIRDQIDSGDAKVFYENITLVPVDESKEQKILSELNEKIADLCT
ncbi:hypothetical protein [Paenibacillus periandrae]|uniref:hypothetical protein n=1 Tax=Paenibacillus periandrae TaxID=1761741 RepID=UPI001F08907F|nr:hypothetical protein [Paenibacillus periandrae]